ncbi:hypothetical protein CEUSTIGMA_g12806.t1 [Chlamydomonas eustigma]|uniref:GED domain-containing protein n=1 Tax=Chlamydomonas eustigma TaxID=1157962 RepID=A0A250XRF1_9CHLO|nr:hypothetical protein CEUSTIGMA_g12806.t1 [Chlamydomonas eustigma]|eukprot:GAX85390.1 hypothetical protein CEUSTIGMA_g12806.t1 [Chlamydomonas eustigma]
MVSKYSTSSPAAFATSKYSKLSTRVIDVCNQLRQLGVSNDIKLPTLVTAGNQSSGKSSVVEAIAGIPLPRSSGTCTRCPTEVRMRHEKPSATTSESGWLCRIKLKREFDGEGQRLHEVPSEQLFCTVTRQQDITACVSAAQAVLLNPDIVSQTEGGVAAFTPCIADDAQKEPEHSRFFLELPTEYQLEFTRNSVVLEIEGADADLTIIDLPGIIQSHHKGPHYVEMIKNMVLNSIEPDHVIIVMVITAMDDVENQAINLEARNVDPQGQRTIGVITKPDNIPKGEHDKWVALASNRRRGQELSLGYYVVRNPGQHELDESIRFEEARVKESEYFETSPYWPSNGELQGRLGTTFLRNALSDLLVQGILKGLPDMQRQAQQKLEDIRQNLKALPIKPIDDVQYDFHNKMKAVAERIENEAKGLNGFHKGFLQKLKTSYIKFEEAVEQTLPAFKVKEEVIALGAEDGVKVSQEAFFNVVTLEVVEALRSRHMGMELPGYTPYSALEELLGIFKEQWRTATSECLSSAREILEVLIDKHLEKVFAQHPLMHFKLRQVQQQLDIVSNTVDENTSECEDRLQRLLDMERNTFTMHKEAITVAKAAFLVRLKKAYVGPYNTLDQAHEESILHALVSSNVHNFKRVEDIFLAQPTAVDAELEMMAATLAYYKIALKRVVDTVPQHIEDYLLRDTIGKDRFSHTVCSKIYKSLGGESAGELDTVAMRELMAEHEHIESRRRRLEDLQQRLTRSLAVMRNPLQVSD